MHQRREGSSWLFGAVGVSPMMECEVVLLIMVCFDTSEVLNMSINLTNIKLE